MTLAMNRRTFLSGTAIVAACAALPAPAFAQGASERTNYALIVAVTKYHRIKGADLIGPNNDAELAYEYLTTGAPVPFAPENVAVLADDIAISNGSPSRQAILDAFADLAKKAKRGDFIYLHFGGHGIQQPAIDVASESDGMDETFLPNDIENWVDRSKGIPNALPDDEIGASLDAIRATGAFVWLVLDCCHSGTATRAAGLGEDDVVERKVDPSVLGIPQEAFAAAAAEAAAVHNVGTRSVGGGEPGTRGLAMAANTDPVNLGDASPDGATNMTPGGMVAFFAAQTVEVTPEMLLPRGAEDARKYGLFSHTILSQLAQNPNVTYRQLGQAIMQAYSAGNRTRPTPLFEGKLDAPVFGTQAGDAVRQWPLQVTPAGITIAAGTLHGVTAGTRLALLPSPTSRLDETVGYVEVRSANNLTARVGPVEHEGKPVLTGDRIPAGAYARLTEIGFDTELVVSLPPESASFPAEVAQVRSILEQLAAPPAGPDEQKKPLKIRLVQAQEPADIKLAVLSEAEIAKMVEAAGAGPVATMAEATRAAPTETPRVWFLPPTAEVSLDTGHRPPSIGLAGSTPDGLVEEVGDNLIRIFRATNLARLGGASSFRPEEFEVKFRIRRPDTDTFDDLLAGTTPKVHPLDEVHLVAKNNSGKPVDLNVLYIGSDYSISHMHAERLHPGSNLDLGLFYFNESSYGVERMVVVLTEGNPITPMEDLSFLAQEGVRVMTRAVGSPQGFSGLLRDIADAPATRGAMKMSQSSQEAKGGLMIFSLENMPRA